jgi:hypothetical protein
MAEIALQPSGIAAMRDTRRLNLISGKRRDASATRAAEKAL